jgi:hypothetical protein
MKVISWNLKNISANKLKNKFQPLFQSYGLGNNVLGYIVNVVMGADQWEDVISPAPADLFVVIELKTGGSAKGAAVSGNCYPTLDALKNALNAAVPTLNYDPQEYDFDYVNPIYVTGQHETVGFIYNKKALTPTGTAVERDTSNNAYLPGRTPLVATFDVVGKAGVSLRFSGIHDPPPSGAAAVRMRPPINYCVRLVNTPSAKVVNTFFLGDFNCQPSDNYINGKGNIIYPFADLYAVGYGTELPDDTLTSVRRKLVSTNPGESAYLNAAYDNNIYHVSTANPNVVVGDEEVPDLIGEAKDMTFDPPSALYPTNGRATLNAYNAVSDHLPVIIDFNVI